MPRDRYLDPYRESVDEHGADHFEATLWANPRTQKVRFDIFTQMAFLPGKRILDAGCSRGDLATYLIEKDIAFERYIGVDGLCDVIEKAQQLELPNCEFHCGDMLADPKLFKIGEPDIVLVSGTLNTMTLREAIRFLDAAWDAAGQMLLFNFLPDTCGERAPKQTGPANRLATHKLLDWAFYQTPLVAYRQDYLGHGHDATIMMKRG